MRAGFAKADITPQPGVDLTGYLARMGPSTAIHDSLHCRALVLSDGRIEAAVVVCDALGFGLEYTRQVKRQIEDATGVPSSGIMLAATHTHSGPASMFLNHCGELAMDWVSAFPAKAVETVRQAKAALSPVEVRLGKAQVRGVALNRRARGTGPLDEELTKVEFWRQDGTLAGTLLHFTCHAVVLGHENLLVSADFPGAACARVEAATGAPCIYLQGPCGDINPVIHPGTFEQVAEVGGLVAAGAAAAKPSPLAGEGLSVRSAEAIFPLGPVPALEWLMAFRREQEDLAAREEHHIRARGYRAMESWADSTIRSYCSGLLARNLEVPLQEIEIGNLVLIAVPGELFVEFGLEAKRLASAAGKHAVVVAYANGDVGYIPTASAYEEGGYEVASAYRYYGYAAALAPQAGAAVSRFLLDSIGG